MSPQDAGGSGPKLPELYVETPKPARRRSLTQVLSLAGLLVGVGALIFWGMGWLAVERPSGEELYQRTLNGSTEMRRMSAAEWARRLQAEHDGGRVSAPAPRPGPAETERLGDVLREAPLKTRDRDAVYLTSVAAVLGYSSDSAAASKALLDFLRAVAPGDLNEVQIFSLISLARLQVSDEDVVRILLKRAQDPDPSLRKAAAFAASALEGGALENELRQGLAQLLADPEDDVRWNAAFGLARRQDPRARPVLRSLLEQAERAGTREGPVLTEETLSLFREAFKAVFASKDEELMQTLRRIADSHPHLKLRQIAKENSK